MVNRVSPMNECRQPYLISLLKDILMIWVSRKKLVLICVLAGSAALPSGRQERGSPVDKVGRKLYFQSQDQLPPQGWLWTRSRAGSSRLPQASNGWEGSCTGLASSDRPGVLGGRGRVPVPGALKGFHAVHQVKSCSPRSASTLLPTNCCWTSLSGIKIRKRCSL